MLIDPHCHLDDPELVESLDEVFRLARDAGVNGALIPGYGPERWAWQSEILRNELFAVWGAFGWHPWALEPDRDLAYHEEAMESGWTARVSRWGEKLKAVGEFGLDRSRRGQRVPLDLQRDIFRLHLRWARKLHLPVILHLVRADGAALELLEESPPTRGGVIHAFGSHSGTMGRYAELGLSFSFGSALLTSEKVRDSLRAVPLNRLMFETDAPAGLRGDFPSPRGPGHLGKIVEAASQVLGKSVEYLLLLHRENCARVFDLQPPESTRRI